MPAMSPLMTEGTITCWKIREGDAFTSGDVLLQIVCDLSLPIFMVQSNWYVHRNPRLPRSMLKLTALVFLARFWLVFFSNFVRLLPEHKVTDDYLLAAGRNYQCPGRTSYRTCRQRYVWTRSASALTNYNTIFISYYSFSYSSSSKS